MISNQREAQEKLPLALDAILKEAESASASEMEFCPTISDELKSSIEYIQGASENSSSAFTNVVTSLAIKAAFPEVDIRYHQEQIQDRTPNGAGFSFRTLSEILIYPWLSRNRFDGAKSGWQTRTFERDDPYTLSYPHKIGGKKPDLRDNFLRIYDQVQDKEEDASEALKYLLFLQVRKRDSQTVSLATPRTDDIDLIIGLLNSHFQHPYEGKGASRLPVLAVYGMYQVITNELRRFERAKLKQLEAHSAADARTGSIGDIEVEDEGGIVFEALEIKHNLRVELKSLTSAEDKISKSKVTRYYILTTHADCSISDESKKIVANVDRLYGCRIIVNGVLSTLKYYLRLLEDPRVFLERYVTLLNREPAIAFEHRAAWNHVVDVATS